MRNLIYIPIIALVFLLAGCTGLATSGLTESEQEQITPRMHYAFERERLNGYLESFRDYAKMPRCSVTLLVGCSEQAVIDRGHELASQVDVVLDQAEAIVLGQMTGDFDLTVETAQIAFNSLVVFLVNQEIIKGAKQ